MFGIGAGELLIILIAGLVIFGPGKLPEVGRAVGKGLREFRKAQAAFSATLDEVSAEPKPKPKTSQPITQPEQKSETEKISLEKPTTENIIAEKKSSDETAVNVDDVISMAKTNSLTKENSNEKISGGTDSVADNANIRQRLEPTRSGGDSSAK
ncbi:MAG: twin-arginine translocase TatA/TatE family subunit [Selenomonadaceae bacterium]|nr:twin-arginine translocase TatA/TatE family subunit [Selenomonadaceae bacterium]